MPGRVSAFRANGVEGPRLLWTRVNASRAPTACTPTRAKQRTAPYSVKLLESRSSSCGSERVLKFGAAEPIFNGYPSTYLAPVTQQKKATTRLEKLNWIAGIGSCIVGALAFAWAVWVGEKPEHNSPYTLSTSSSIVAQEGGVIIQGDGNTVISHRVDAFQGRKAERFVDIDIEEYVVDLKEKTRHEVKFPQISGRISKDVLARANHFIKRTALTEYERYLDMDEVRVSYVVGLKEFNLLGISFEIFASGDRAAHPLSSTYATTLDLETGSPLTLKDFLVLGYEGSLNELVRQKLVARQAYFPCETLLNATKAVNPVSSALEQITGHSSNTCFDTVADDTQYFLTDTSLVIVFPKFAVAPGVAGDIEIPIRFVEIRNLIRSDGPLNRFL